MNHKRLKTLLENNFNLLVSDITDAPRQFVAETFFVNTENETFFCKVVDKPLFIEGLTSSLPVLANIHNLGYSRINYPIPTASGDLHVKIGVMIIVLFNFINAPQNYDYNNAVFGKTIADVHQLSSHITASINQEKFLFKHEDMFMGKLNQLSSEDGHDDIATDLDQLMKSNYSTIVSAFNQLQVVAKECIDTDLDYVVTHGDAPGNVLVKSPDDIYIVDWDDILLAPAERDLWAMIDKQDFVDGYSREISKYEPHQKVLDYYLLSRYFNDLIEYWAEILGDYSDEHRRTNFKQLNRELFSEDGWLHQMIQEFLSSSM